MHGLKSAISAFLKNCQLCLLVIQIQIQAVCTAWHPRFLADQLTLFKPGGKIIPTPLLLLGTRESKILTQVMIHDKNQEIIKKSDSSSEKPNTRKLSFSVLSSTPSCSGIASGKKQVASSETIQEFLSSDRIQIAFVDTLQRMQPLCHCT